MLLYESINCCKHEACSNNTNYKYYSPFLACRLEHTQLYVINSATWFHKTHFWERKERTSKHAAYFELHLIPSPPKLAGIWFFDTDIVH
jgi:hypothetical protein